MTSISLSQINYVLALEKTGSFSQAAEQCFVTQSTLSTMVKKLEDQLDLQLFDRRSKPIKLTQEGKVLIDQFKVIYNEFDNLNELVQETKQEFYGTLKIGIIPTLAPFLLPLFLTPMVSKYPTINFSVDEITTNEIVNKIKLRELDIGILSLPLDDRELIQKSLFFEEFLIYDANGPADAKKKYKIEDINVNRLWLLEESHCLTSQIEKICHLRKKRKASHNLMFNSGSILSLLELVKINNGITLIPRLATQRKNLLNKRFIYQMGNPIPVREIGLITHPNFAKKRFMKMLENEITEGVKPILKNLKKVKVIKPY
ncbi:MAG: LysR family transcriptional regulator [Flavobacteriaceae bacterium]|nr:LysR family transcriptional regulator [Flavobacteriaceae bacterium]